MLGLFLLLRYKLLDIGGGGILDARLPLPRSDWPRRICYELLQQVYPNLPIRRQPDPAISCWLSRLRVYTFPSHINA